MTTPGYWLILSTDVEQAEAQARYVAAWRPVAERYGAQVHALAPATVLAESEGHARVLVVTFPSHAQAVACHQDPAYQAAAAHVRPWVRRSLLILAGEPPLG